MQDAPPVQTLLIEDDEADVFFIREMLAGTCTPPRPSASSTPTAWKRA